MGSNRRLRFLLSTLLVSAALAACEPANNARSDRAAPPSTDTQPAHPSIGTIQRSDPGGTWLLLAPMNEHRLAHVAAALDGLIYVVGGIGVQSTNTVQVYDPRTNRWSFRKPLPVSTDHGWAGAAHGRIIVGDGHSKRVFSFDPGADEWSELAQSHFHHGETPAVGVIDGRIYVAGGIGQGMLGVEAEVYDPTVNRWTVLPSMKCSRHHTVGGVIDGRFHVVSGRPGVQRCHEVFDPATRAWARKADLPTGREGAAGAAVGRWFLVFGGEGNPDDPDLVSTT
jgi:N-acetylneuraminic acid mutarotase